MLSQTYQLRRGQIENYFDRVASDAWARLTSDEKVSGIRATVRAGRDTMRATLLSWLPDDLRGRRILDAGCGTGILVPSLLAAYARTKLIIELDFAEEMLRRNRAKYRNSRLVRLAGDATNLPFPDESIDLILCFNTAPHLGDGEAAFRELFRVLAPGGTMAVGHLMSSLELNRFHANLNGPIAQDRLPPAKEMGKLFGALGGKDVIAQEQPGWYFVRVNKPE